MAKIHSYGSARTAPIEYIETTATDLVVGDLATVADGKVSKAEGEPTYLVVGKVYELNEETKIVPVVAILDDMVLESETAITGLTKIADKLYRK